jgi:glycogen debranching enzyme
MDSNKLSEATLKKAYQHLESWTNWWMNYNDTDEDGIPDYPMGCDSGWDNATVFDLSYFVESPDLSAFLVLQMNTLSKIAENLGNKQQAAEWKQKSKALYEKFMKHSWTKNGLVAKVSQSHKYDADPTCLITLIPLVLGDLLEPAKRKLMIDRLKKDFLTEYGLATEKHKGPYYKADNYWRGAIWAPSTYLIVDGLMRAGEKELALTIAQRFCDMIAFTANGDFENFDALSGKGLRASGYTWTSSVNLLLLKLLDENKSGKK